MAPSLWTMFSSSPSHSESVPIRASPMRMITDSPIRSPSSSYSQRIDDEPVQVLWRRFSTTSAVSNASSTSSATAVSSSSTSGTSASRTPSSYTATTTTTAVASPSPAATQSTQTQAKPTEKKGDPTPYMSYKSRKEEMRWGHRQGRGGGRMMLD